MIFGLAMLAVGLMGCDKGRKNPPDTDVRVVNVVPRYFALAYRRVESTPQSIDFRSGSVFTYDEDTYVFNIETQDVKTGAPQRILSFPQKLSAGSSYTFVIYDKGASIDRFVLEAPTIPSNATDTQIDALHAANGQPAMDFYITPTNSGIVGATPVGTVAFLQQVAPRRIPAGDYEITITAAGNPANVILKTQSFTLPAGRHSSFVIAADVGFSNNPISLIAIGNQSSALVNVNALASLRVVMAPEDKAPRDVAVEGQFSPPLFPAVPFATETAYATVPVSANLKINVTPPGNPGVIELESTSVAAGPTTLNTILITGAAGALAQLNMVEDNRRLSQIGRLRFYNAAPQVTGGVDFFIVPPGTDVSTVLPYVSLIAPGASEQLPLIPGTYDIVLRQAGTTTVVAGPIPVTIEPGGLYGVLATNGANGVSADLTLLDDFP